MTFLSYARADAAPLAQRLDREFPNTWPRTLDIGGARSGSSRLNESSTTPTSSSSPFSFPGQTRPSVQLNALR
jgi:hypothetical protein